MKQKIEKFKKSLKRNAPVIGAAIFSAVLTATYFECRRSEPSSDISDVIEAINKAYGSVIIHDRNGDPQYKLVSMDDVV